MKYRTKYKKKAKKPASKSKGQADAGEEDGPHPLLREIWGLASLSVSLVTIIALLSEFVGGANILGPYLGGWWAFTLNTFAGSFPVLFLVAAITIFGLKLVLNKEGIKLRFILSLSLLFVATGILLSIRNIGIQQLTSTDYQHTGGYFGTFLVQKCFLPIFGPSHFGPYLVTLIGVLFIVVWGFRVSAVSLSEQSAAFLVLILKPFFRGLTRLWHRPDGEAAGMEEEEDSESGEVTGIIPPARPAAKKALPVTPKPEPLPKKGKTELIVTPPEEKTALFVADAPAYGGPSAAIIANLNRPEPERDAAINTVLRNLNDGKLDVEELDPPTIRKLRDLLDSGKVDTDELDPLVIRKIRDLALERKRVSELNDWEQRARHPEITGMLKGGKGDKPIPGPEARAPEPAIVPVEPAADEEAARFAAGMEEESPAKKKSRRKPAAEESLANAAPDANTMDGDADEEAASPAADMDDADASGFAATDNADEDDGEVEVDPEGGIVEFDEGTKPAPKLQTVPKPAAPAVKYDIYKIPSIDEIFAEPPVQPLEFTEEELRVQSKLLEDQLINFKVMGKVVQILPGPVITRYEVELAPGVKVNRISNLADDLALALKAKSIRILAPIPGKSVVGVEVPNRKSQMVYIKEILKAPEFAVEDDTLKITVGKTIGGDPYVMDLTRAPHLLIAGQTGSGKSVCINSIMTSFLCSKTPDELRMILVDPKVVELKPYDDIPHLLYPVITQPDVAVQALKWATFEMDHRYDVLALCGVRNIKGFNQKFREGRLPEAVEEEDRKLMPFMVIVIDELADLMMVAGKEVETNIARIAQKARAVGIHLILATQRPSTNVITGTIKANLPTRIAFQVASQIDARTIMDKMGAEKLLGRGDMLFRPIEFPEPIRLHGCYIDDDQTEQLTKFCSNQFVNYPQITSFNMEDDPAGNTGFDEERDEKFREAAELVVQVKQASVSLLQRRLGIGYARSGRLVDQLERAGIVGRERGSKPREVLMDEETLRSFLSSGLNG